MKISIKIHDSKYSVELSDDANLERVMEEINALLKTMYSSESVDKYWNE